jgi:hypothetical protein
MLKKETHIRFAIFTLLLFSFSLIGCKKDKVTKITGASWESNLAIPVCHGNLNINQLTASSQIADLITISPITGALSLGFDADLFTIESSDIVQLVNYNQVYNLDAVELGLIAIPNFSGEIEVEKSIDIAFPLPNGMEINQLNFKNGTMTITSSTTLQHDLELHLSFIDLSLNNQTIERTIELEYEGNATMEGSTQIDLASVIADFTGGGTGINSIRVEAEIEIEGTNQPIIGDEYIDITFEITDQDFTYMNGYFGQTVLSSLKDSILMSLFNDPMQGNFVLTNPEITFNIENSFGIPVALNLVDLRTSTLSGTQTVLSGFPSSISIDAPTINGQSENTSFVLDANNTTNLSSIISAEPKNFIYSVNAEINPDGNSGPLNYIDESNTLAVSAAINIPIEGYANDVVMTDTIDFTFTQNVNSVQGVTFRLDISNGFPIDASMHAIFVDENYNPLFSLLDDAGQLISGAPLDSEGHAVGATSKISSVAVNASELNLLSEVKHILIISNLATSGGQSTPVKLLSSYTIGFEIGMEVSLKTSF